MYRKTPSIAINSTILIGLVPMFAHYSKFLISWPGGDIQFNLPSLLYCRLQVLLSQTAQLYSNPSFERSFNTNITGWLYFNETLNTTITSFHSMLCSSVWCLNKPVSSVRGLRWSFQSHRRARITSTQFELRESRSVKHFHSYVLMPKQKMDLTVIHPICFSI